MRPAKGQSEGTGGWFRRHHPESWDGDTFIWPSIPIRTEPEGDVFDTVGARRVQSHLLRCDWICRESAKRVFDGGNRIQKGGDMAAMVESQRFDLHEEVPFDSSHLVALI